MKNLLCGFLMIAALPVCAQSVDIEVGYAARETRPTTDNDLFFVDTGFTWADDRGFKRLELMAAMRNNDFSGDYPMVLGVEASRVLEREESLLAFGGRLNYADDITTATEAMVGYMRFWDNMSFRASAGAWATEGNVPGRSQNSGLVGVLETSWYPAENWALRAGIQVDADGELAAFTGEWNIGKSNVSLLVETAVAFDEYRGQKSYDNLTVSLRWAPGHSRPQNRDRKVADRILHRFADTQ